MAFPFIQWIISLFSGKNDPERIKKQSLRRMTKILAANKYRKFYHVKTEEVDPELAHFFFDIYRILSPAQTLMQNAAQSTQLKIAVVQSVLEKTQQDILENISPESLGVRAQETPSRELAAQIQQEFDTLAASVTEDQIDAINDCYSLILVFSKFVNFDFYFFLRKFDNQLKEHTFSRKPLFSPVRGMLISDIIKDFLELTEGIDQNRDWDLVFSILNMFKGVNVVNPKLWNSMVLRLGDVKRSNILEMIIRFVDQDPDWSWSASIPKGDIVSPYLDSIKSEIFEHLNQLTTEKIKARIAEYAALVFGDSKVNRLKYYTERAEEIYLKNNFEGFTMAGGLNYLQAFLLNEKDEFRFLYELILVRGQWVHPALSLPLSEAVRLILAFPDRIVTLDNSLSDGGLYGGRLKSAIMRVAREKSQTKFITSNLETINDNAKQILNDAIFNLSVLQDGFRDILDDYRKNPSLIILNWRDLEPFSDEPLEARIVKINNKLYNILQLLRVFATTKE
jgi:hypothetical protein